MKNAYKRGVRLSLTVSPQVSRYLDDLLRTGVYGRTRAEVAQRLLYAQVRETVDLLPKKERRR